MDADDKKRLADIRANVTPGHRGASTEDAVFLLRVLDRQVNHYLLIADAIAASSDSTEHLAEITYQTRQERDQLRTSLDEANSTIDALAKQAASLEADREYNAQLATEERVARERAEAQHDATMGELAKVRGQLADALKCSTCGGDPQSHPSGKECICAGDGEAKTGTRDGEVMGLRLALYDEQHRNDMSATPPPATEGRAHKWSGAQCEECDLMAYDPKAGEPCRPATDEQAGERVAESAVPLAALKEISDAPFMSDAHPQLWKRVETVRAAIASAPAAAAQLVEEVEALRELERVIKENCQGEVLPMVIHKAVIAVAAARDGR